VDRESLFDQEITGLTGCARIKGQVAGHHGRQAEIEELVGGVAEEADHTDRGIDVPVAVPIQVDGGAELVAVGKASGGICGYRWG
jgi:hypothetical protein